MLRQVQARHNCIPQFTFHSSHVDTLPYSHSGSLNGLSSCILTLFSSLTDLSRLKGALSSVMCLFLSPLDVLTAGRGRWVFSRVGVTPVLCSVTSASSLVFMKSSYVLTLYGVAEDLKLFITELAQSFSLRDTKADTSSIHETNTCPNGENR